MLKAVLITIIGLVFIQDAKSYQCQSITPEKMLSVSNYVFTAKILSKNDEVANLSVIKTYKGSLQEKTQILFPGKILKGYRLLENLEVGETYLFSSYQSLNEDNKLIKIKMCDWKQNIKNSKAIIDSLDKQQKQ